MNLVLGMVVLAGASASVWYGITDPEGGIFAGLANLMHGTPNAKHTSTTAAAFLATVAGLSSTPAVPGIYPTTPDAGGGVGGSSPASGSGSATRQRVMDTARTWLGVPYLWGGNTRRGVDCSGFTCQVFLAVGIKLPRVAAAQQLTGVSRPESQAQVGDLVFFGAPAHHVGIYAGGGQIIHAPHTGAVVRFEKIWTGEPVTVRDVITPHEATHRPAGHVPTGIPATVSV